MHECLTDALVAAKIRFAPILKTRTAKIKSGKGDFGYRYASLEDVIEAVEGALTENGIAQVQRMAVRDGLQLLVTELHWKNEVLSGEMVLPLEGLDPQGCGRVISYFRRYTLQALLGITAEDDDAADAQHVRQPAARRAPEPEPESDHHELIMHAGRLLEAIQEATGRDELAEAARQLKGPFDGQPFWPQLIRADRPLAAELQQQIKDKALGFGLDLSGV
jgi:hypothetical protein